MNELLQAILTDESVRTKEAVLAAAADSSEEFLPWAGKDLQA